MTTVDDNLPHHADAAEVAAHQQAETHRYVMHFPAHAPRTGDPHYTAFEAYRRHTKDSAVCYVGEHVGFGFCSKGPLELHHGVLEFAVANAADPAALHRDFADIPEDATAEQIATWLESSPSEFRWLCVLPGVAVLMADGSERPIEDVQPGEFVVSAEGRSCRVTAVGAKRYRGEVARFGASALTLSHRLRVPGGWAPAGQVVQEIRMLSPDMVRLRCVKDQVLSGVVGAVSVEMVDALAAQQRAPDDLLHDPAVFHLEAADATAVHHDANVALGVHVAAGAVATLPRRPVQSPDPALIGAIPARSGSPVGAPVERVAADLARHEMVWVAPVAPTIGLYSGYVHDLSVEHDHSFIAGGVAVHNCAFHHRGHGGAHTASHADWTAQLYVPGLIT